MFKKFFALILLSSIFSLNAFEQDHLDQLSNPTQKYFANLDLRGADLSNLCLNDSVFEKVEFNGTILNNTNFTNTVFIKCNFVDTIFDKTIIIGSRFSSCNMQKVYMFSGQFLRAIFDIKSSNGIIFE